MKQKKVLAGAASLCLLFSAGAAKADPLSWYLGADLVQLETKIDDKTGVPPIVTGSAKATTLRIRGGMHILNWLDAELHGVLPNEETYSTAGQTNTVDTAVFGIFARPHADFGPASVYGLFGFASSSLDFKGVIEGNKTISDVAYGLGAQYKFNRNFAAQIDYTHYNKGNLDLPGFTGGIDAEVSAVGIGVTYTF